MQFHQSVEPGFYQTVELQLFDQMPGASVMAASTAVGCIGHRSQGLPPASPWDLLHLPLWIFQDQLIAPDLRNSCCSCRSGPCSRGHGGVDWWQVSSVIRSTGKGSGVRCG